jgi:hypothetical protein
MRFILGFALTVAFSAVLTSAVVHVLQPQIDEATSAVQYLADHWPR